MASKTEAASKRPRGAAARSSAENALYGTIGGNELWSRLHGAARTAATAAARAAGPGSDEAWEKKLDPNGEMTPEDRRKCARNAKRAYYSRLALASARARRKGPANDDTVDAEPGAA